MARIKKRGLDYFPMNTDFLQSRSVRRLLKREGDAALAALLGALSIIYDDEGYFVRLDDDLCEDLSDGLFSLEAADVRRVLQTAVEVGLFDEGMFREHGILTSEDIQRQFLFIKRPRKRALIDERYCLLPPDEEEENAAAPADGEGTKVQDLGTKSTQIVQKTPENVDFTPQSTQSKEKESIEKQSKADLLPNGSPQTGGTPAAGRMPAGEEEDVGVKTPGGAPYEWTHDTIGRLVPPPDGLPRNLDGLRLTMDQFRITPREQYAIICLSNFGLIGHPVWQGFVQLRAGRGRIREPGRFLLSLCHPKKVGVGSG